MNTLVVADASNSFSLTTPAMYSAPSESAHLAEDTTTTPSDGAHLAETPQVVGNPNCDSKTWKDILGDDCILRKKEEGQPAATQGDKQLQPFKAKTAPTVAIHILQFLVQHLKVPAEIKLQSQTFHNDEWGSYCDDRVVECSCRECPA